MISITKGPHLSISDEDSLIILKRLGNRCAWRKPWQVADKPPHVTYTTLVEDMWCCKHIEDSANGQ